MWGTQLQTSTTSSSSPACSPARRARRSTSSRTTTRSVTSSPVATSAITDAALRAVSPDLLNLGPRFDALTHARPTIYEVAGRSVDVISSTTTSTTLPCSAADQPSSGPRVSSSRRTRGTISTPSNAGGRPILITEFSYRASVPGGPLGTQPSRVPLLPTTRPNVPPVPGVHGELYARPFVVGAHWFQLMDQPAEPAAPTVRTTTSASSTSRATLAAARRRVRRREQGAARGSHPREDRRAARLRPPVLRSLAPLLVAAAVAAGCSGATETPSKVPQTSAPAPPARPVRRRRPRPRPRPPAPPSPARSTSCGPGSPHAASATARRRSCRCSPITVTGLQNCDDGLPARHPPVPVRARRSHALVATQPCTVTTYLAVADTWIVLPIAGNRSDRRGGRGHPRRRGARPPLRAR